MFPTMKTWTVALLWCGWLLLLALYAFVAFSPTMTKMFSPGSAVFMCLMGTLSLTMSVVYSVALWARVRARFF